MNRLRTEAGRIAAFARRDLLIRWSYRASFVSDILDLVFEVALFAFVARIVDPDAIPTYGGEGGYLPFVTIGIAFGAFLAFGLGQVATAMRSEQLIGTLEPLMMTPVRPLVMHLGLAAYDLLYVPIRTAVFLAGVSVFFGVDFLAAGIAPALLSLLLFVPFVWGLGLLGAAAVIAFKRGGAGLGPLALALNVTSGAYVPVEALPDWVARLADYNPVTAALEAARLGLLGGAGLSEVAGLLAVVGGAAVGTMAVGSFAVSQALARERRRGSLVTY